MVGLVVFISLSLFAVCQAGSVPATPVRCGAMPRGLNRCLLVPTVVKPGVTAVCDNNLPVCDKITCVFRKSGWMDGDKVDKLKLAAYYDQSAKDYPDWQPAVEQAKNACVLADLPPQGVHLNCPTFDIMQCSFATLIKSAQPSQWSSDASCASLRQYAAACPVCPSDCFEAQIPVGSCNACFALPRSP